MRWPRASSSGSACGVDSGAADKLPNIAAGGTAAMGCTPAAARRAWMSATVLRRPLDTLTQASSRWRQLVTAFNLDATPDLATALALSKAANGGPTDFPAGAWRLYAEVLKAPFKALGEMAVRLGYPAE